MKKKKLKKEKKPQNELVKTSAVGSDLVSLAGKSIKKPEIVISRIRKIAREYGYDIEGSQILGHNIVMVFIPENVDFEIKEISRALKMGVE